MGTLLAIGTTIPSFYFLYNLVWEKYDSEKFYNSIKQGVDWINYLNAFSVIICFTKCVYLRLIRLLHILDSKLSDFRIELLKLNGWLPDIRIG